MRNVFVLRTVFYKVRTKSLTSIKVRVADIYKQVRVADIYKRNDYTNIIKLTKMK